MIRKRENSKPRLCNRVLNCSTNNSKKPLSTTNGTRLGNSYIAIGIKDEHLSKVSKLLPTPTHKDWVQGRDYYKHIFVYVIDGYITSHNQYRWISNIKLGIKAFIFVPFNFIDDLHISNNADITHSIYTIKELSQAFKAPIIYYPKIMYPSTKKDVYKHLCWHGKRLIHQQVFTHEALIRAALLMNEKLTDKLSNKDLHKKALGAYVWLVENIDGFEVGLSVDELKQAHSKGAATKNQNQAQHTKQLVDEAIATGDYFKPNGSVNKTKLAKALNMYRRTLDKYVNDV